jgi:ADP-ribose pyrophosphatase
VDSTKIVEGIHGLDEEHEDILVRTVDFSEAYRLVETNAIESAIPIIAIQWLALNKQKLQAKWVS